MDLGFVTDQYGIKPRLLNHLAGRKAAPGLKGLSLWDADKWDNLSIDRWSSPQIAIQAERGKDTL